MVLPTNTCTYRFSKVLNAPLEFVFEWCTDFRDTEATLRSRPTIMEKGDQHFVWGMRHGKGRVVQEGVRAVWVHPPNSWYLDGSGDGREIGSYVLSPVDRVTTRIDIEFTFISDTTEELEDEADWKREWDERWTGYKEALERDYLNAAVD